MFDSVTIMADFRRDSPPWGGRARRVVAPGEVPHGVRVSALASESSRREYDKRMRTSREGIRTPLHVNHSCPAHYDVGARRRVKIARVVHRGGNLVVLEDHAPRAVNDRTHHCGQGCPPSEVDRRRDQGKILEQRHAGEIERRVGRQAEERAKPNGARERLLLQRRFDDEHDERRADDFARTTCAVPIARSRNPPSQ